MYALCNKLNCMLVIKFFLLPQIVTIILQNYGYF